MTIAQLEAAPSKLNKEARFKIADYLKTNHLPQGMGKEHNACSIAAINLALNGFLTDDIPSCMDETIGSWIIAIQDAMPDELRNSDGWKRLLPYAAGTRITDKRKFLRAQKARDKIIRDWLFEKVVPSVRKLSDNELTEEGKVELRKVLQHAHRHGELPDHLIRDSLLEDWADRYAKPTSLDYDDLTVVHILRMVDHFLDVEYYDGAEEISWIIDNNLSIPQGDRVWRRLGIVSTLKELILA